MQLTYLVDVRSNQVVQFVQDAVNDLHQQMALLIFKSRRHEQGQNLIEKRPSTKLPGLVCDLPEGSLK